MIELKIVTLNISFDFPNAIHRYWKVGSIISKNIHSSGVLYQGQEGHDTQGQSSGGTCLCGGDSQ